MTLIVPAEIDVQQVGDFIQIVQWAVSMASRYVDLLQHQFMMWASKLTNFDITINANYGMVYHINF